MASWYVGGDTAMLGQMGGRICALRSHSQTTPRQKIVRADANGHLALGEADNNDSDNENDVDDDDDHHSNSNSHHSIDENDEETNTCDGFLM